LPGDEIFGLQSAFAMAGASAVIGCLWAAQDEVARAMMIELHQNLARGCAPDLALQAAVVNWLGRVQSRHCYSWAPFFLSILGGRATLQRTENHNV
jgi:CHAT domain-containing protein